MGVLLGEWFIDDPYFVFIFVFECIGVNDDELVLFCFCGGYVVAIYHARIPPPFRNHQNQYKNKNMQIIAANTEINTFCQSILNPKIQTLTLKLTRVGEHNPNPNPTSHSLTHSLRFQALLLRPTPRTAGKKKSRNTAVKQHTKTPG